MNPAMPQVAHRTRIPGSTPAGWNHGARWAVSPGAGAARTGRVSGTSRASAAPAADSTAAPIQTAA